MVTNIASGHKRVLRSDSPDARSMRNGDPVSTEKGKKVSFKESLLGEPSLLVYDKLEAAVETSMQDLMKNQDTMDMNNGDHRVVKLTKE